MLDVAIVGAGVSGLTLARALAIRGREAVVFERSRGVGGRCATRRIDGQPVDHGVAYLHGRSQRFLSELGALVGEPRIEGWPRTREGNGVPCQPEAFDAGEARVALEAGVSRFAKWLARGLKLRLNANLAGIRYVANDPDHASWELRLRSGEQIRARNLVLTMPVPSALQLLRETAALPEAAVRLFPLLGMVRTLPCLTVLARYPRSVRPPEWEASVPVAGAEIHTILHDSSKRPEGSSLMLVLQARPRFSREHLNDPTESWTGEMLAAAASLHGSWVAHPELVQSHVWRHARVDATSRLSGPILTTFEGGGSLGLAGDGFHGAGGVEGAYLSGLGLADRLTAATTMTPTS